MSPFGWIESFPLVWSDIDRRLSRPWCTIVHSLGASIHSSLTLTPSNTPLRVFGSLLPVIPHCISTASMNGRYFGWLGTNNAYQASSGLCGIVLLLWLPWKRSAVIALILLQRCERLACRSGLVLPQRGFDVHWQPPIQAVGTYASSVCLDWLSWTLMHGDLKKEPKD